MPDPTGRVSHLPHFHRGMAWKEPVRVATTADITIATALNNGDSLDGVTLATGDRVLVKDQSTGNQNGIYVVGASPARAYDMDQDGTTSVVAEEIAGAFVYVIAGTANAGKVFHTTNVAGGTLGSTTITWTELSSSGGGVTVQDEGTPLATTATTLNFTGAGVTASGSGATKTINVPGGGVATDSIWDAKGDLAAATGADAAVKVTVGSNDQVLTADSGQSAGVKWATPKTVATDTIWDAKGDLAAGTGADTASKLTVGSNDTILMADSGQSTGLKWVASQTPSTQNYSDSASEGTADTYSRGDHKHAMPAASGAVAGLNWIASSADEDATNVQNQDHTEFQFAVVAGRWYVVQGWFLTSANNATADFEYRLAVTAGTMEGRGHTVNQDSTLTIQTAGIATTGAANTGNVAVGTAASADLGFPGVAILQWAFRHNTTNGTFKIQFGNNSTGVGRTSRMMKGSMLGWKEIS